MKTSLSHDSSLTQPNAPPSPSPPSSVNTGTPPATNPTSTTPSTPSDPASTAASRAWDHALSLGIRTLGPSVSDVDSARLACAGSRYRMLQLPLNATDSRFLPLLPEIDSAGLWIAVNRPFAMGRSIGQDSFRYLLSLPFKGVILSGTKSRQHLLENIAAFHAA